MAQFVLKIKKTVPYHGVNPNTGNGARLRSPSPIMATARFRQNTWRNEQILNLANASLKDIILRREKLYLRIVITTENTNWAVSVYDEKLYFCKSAHTALTCTVVKLACLVGTAPVIPVKWTSRISYPASLSRLVISWKACSDILSCAQRTTTESSLVFPTSAQF